ncbi:MAG TPA: 5'/3'-nucleotidase SurE [bacterium]|nr:5'/3'-nucleotidase SurE [bacterium]
MRVLITNDDGIASEGLRALVRAFAPSHEVAVLAPSDDRSASGAALTLRRDLDVQEAQELLRLGAASAYHLDATPATCVILAVSGTLVPRPDLVVSGVNPGPNLGSDIYLSGTVGAARMAATLGIPGVAVSCRRDPAGTAWDVSARMALRTAELLEDEYFGGTEAAGPGRRTPLVNINVPSMHPRSVAATTVASYHIIGHAVIEQAPARQETPRLLRLELRLGALPPLEPGTDACAFFSGDASLTVLHHGDGASAVGGDGLELAHSLARYLNGAVAGLRGAE